MLAKVTATVKYIGGSGLREPVAQLQNALSFNYYANADIYESRSFGQTDKDERYLENLELAYNSEELDINKINFNRIEEIAVSDNVLDFRQLGEVVDKGKYPAITISDGAAFFPEHQIKAGLDLVQYYDVDYSKVYTNLYASYNAYMSQYYTAMNSIVKDNPLDYLSVVYGTLGTTIGGNPLAVDFGIKGESAMFQKNDYPFMHDAANKDALKDSNYFAIGYNSFDKEKAIAQTTKLHLYPQEEKRIVNPENYQIKDFAGVMIPKYVDMPYLSQTLEMHRQEYVKYLNCEEWLPFNNNEALRSLLDKLPITALFAFRANVLAKFGFNCGMLFSNRLQPLKELKGSFIDVYTNTLAVNSICNGVDVGSYTNTDNNTTAVRYLEVVPNENPSDTNPDLETFFNFKIADCLNNYPKVESNNQSASYSVVAADRTDFAGGLINYLYNQMDGTVNPLWFNNNKPYYDFSGGKWMRNGSAVTDIQCKTTFEKMNFEFLYFAQITQLIATDGKVNETAKNFTFEGAKKSLAGYTEVQIQTIKDAGIIVQADSYDYLVMKYNHATQFKSPIDFFKEKEIKLGDVLFFDFIKDFLSYDNTVILREKMLADQANMTPEQITNINRFTNKLLDVPIVEIQNKILQISSEMKQMIDSDFAWVKNDLEPITAAIANTDGYKLKMFETTESRVNAFGRRAYQEYARFYTAYQNKK